MASSSASDIVKGVGGAGNIQSFSHCATRLRFQLKDGTKVDTSAVEAIPAVMGAVPQAGDRYQVVGVLPDVSVGVRPGVSVPAWSS